MPCPIPGCARPWRPRDAGFERRAIVPYNHCMKTALLAPKTEAEVWLRILHPDGDLSPRVARAILRLSFPNDEISRMHELSAKARAGTLTPEEHAAMDNYERVGSILSTLKSKARQVLKRSSRDA